MTSSMAACDNDHVAILAFPYTAQYLTVIFREVIKKRYFTVGGGGKGGSAPSAGSDE